MTTEQFKKLRTIFLVARDEVTNNEQLGDWLINLGGSLIAMGVELANDDDDE
jgi:hypothetical protein